MEEKCTKCGKTGPLKEVLLYCKICKKFYCYDCVIITEGERSYAQYVITTYYECPEDLEILHKD